MFNDLCKQTYEELEKKSSGKQIVLWGRNRERALKAMDKFDNIKYIVDTDCEKWGGAYRGYKVYSADKLYGENPDDIIILVTAGPDYAYEITNQIKMIDNFSVFYLHVLEEEWFNSISNELYDNLDKIKSCIGMLDDDLSKRILAETVKRRIMGCNGSFSDLRTKGEMQYLFPTIYEKCCEKVILDCGAYIGDTAVRYVENFGNRVCKMYCYEALPKNLEALEKVQEKMQKEFGWKGEIVVLPYAVCDKESTIQFWETELPHGSFVPELRNTANAKFNHTVNCFDVKTCSIDDTVPIDEEVTLIKMDIEGAEYEALLGAEKTIKRNKPCCAISIYHNASDYWRLMMLLKEFVPEYKFAVRHYKNRHVDTVLYAWEDD